MQQHCNIVEQQHNVIEEYSSKVIKSPNEEYRSEINTIKIEKNEYTSEIKKIKAEKAKLEDENSKLIVIVNKHDLAQNILELDLKKNSSNLYSVSYKGNKYQSCRKRNQKRPKHVAKLEIGLSIAVMLVMVLYQSVPEMAAVNYLQFQFKSRLVFK